MAGRNPVAPFLDTGAQRCILAPPSAPDQAKSGQADRDADLVASLLDAHNRERAREKLGAKFDIRAFHDELIGAGALPLDVLEQRMDGWIAAQAKP